MLERQTITKEIFVKSDDHHSSKTNVNFTMMHFEKYRSH